jgi:stage V sporulation protein SpoVS
MQIIIMSILKSYNQCWGAGVVSQDYLQEAGAVTTYLVGAGAINNPLKTAPRSRVFLEPEPVKEIYKNGSKEPGARPFLEGA